MMFFLYNACLILLGYGILRLVQRYIQWIVSPLRKIPGPKIHSFVWGYFPEIWKEPFMEPHKRWWKEIGYDVPMFHYTGVLGTSSIVILKKELVKEVLTAPYGKKKLRFHKIMALVKNMIGNGLACVEGEEWMHHRQIIQPAFNTNSLKKSLSESVPRRVEKFIQCWKRKVSSTMTATMETEQTTRAVEIDLSSHLSALTLDIIGDVAFSHDFHGLDCVERWANKQQSKNDDNNTDDKSECCDNEIEPIDDPFMKALSELTQLTPITIFFFVLGSTWVDKHFNLRRKRISKHLDNAVQQIVQNARNKNPSFERHRQQQKEQSASSSSSSPPSSNTSKCKSKSLLQLLFQASSSSSNNNNHNHNHCGSLNSRKTLSDEELRDETKTFMIAGHETTATLCYWAIYALMENPTIQERIYKEMLEHLEKQTNQSGLDLQTLQEMVYFNAFLQEVSRFYPPVGMISRRSNHAEEKLEGYTIPKGTRIVIPIHLLHRHPMYWKDPDTFQPERWIHTNDTEREKFLQEIRFAYLPFSLGGRNCIGQQFAMMEAKLILSSLIQEFVFRRAPSQKDTIFGFTHGVTMKLKPGLKVSIEPRLPVVSGKKNK